MAVSPRRDLLREVPLVAAAILAYFGVRNLTAGSAPTAFENARDLFRLERGLHLDWERSFQSAIAGSDTLVTLANWVYIWGHWPVILTTAVALFLLARDRYYLLRNAIFVSGAIGFLVFALFPVAPPRLLDLGLVDTVTEQSHAYRALQPPGLTNQYAALPSLHFGWNLLLGIVLFRSSTHAAIRLFGLLSPVAMAYAVVATANHFVIDVLAGVAVVLVGLAVAHTLARRHPTPREAGGIVAGTKIEGRRRPHVTLPRRAPRQQRARPAPRSRRTNDAARTAERTSGGQITGWSSPSLGTGKRDRGPQPDSPRARDDECDLVRPDEKKTAAETARADGERRLACRVPAHLLHEPKTAVGSVDAKPLAVSEPVAAIERRRLGSRERAAGSAAPSSPVRNEALVHGSSSSRCGSAGS